MKKPIKFTVETQTEDRETLSICHINLPVIALQSSDTARTMFKLNRQLFDKINSNIKLLSGRVYRMEITNNKKNFNKNGMLIENAYDSEEVHICQLNFVDNNLQKSQRYKAQNNKYHDHNPSINIGTQNKTKINSGYLTEEEIEQMEMVSEIQQIDLFSDIGIKTFLLKDNLNSGKAFKDVAYRIEILCDTDFDNFVKLVADRLKESITFLEKYHSTSKFRSNYNSKTMQFTESFKNFVLESLAIENLDTVDLSQKTIKNSDFGKAGIAFYNATRLIDRKAQKSVYDKILKSLLPLRNNNPHKISSVLKSFENLYSKIQSRYQILQNNTKKDRRAIKLRSKNNTRTILIESTAEKFLVENEKLGYNLFSEKQKRLNGFTTTGYKGRINQERAKYFPAIEISNDGDFLSSKERTRFVNTSNENSYITPANLVLGSKKISTSRGMTNMDVQSVKNFRLAKSARAATKNSANYPSPSTNSSVKQNVLSSFNFTITVPNPPLLERSVDQEIDPLMDAKNYVGENSFFISTNPRFIQDSVNGVLGEDGLKITSIITNVLNRSFLREDNALNSVREIQFSNKKSKVRQLVHDNPDAIVDLPPHIKYMCTSGFQPLESIDPLKNSESREIIEETQKNVFVVKALIGFKKDVDGFFDLNMPIHEELSKVIDESRPLLAKAYSYEVPELGIVKDKFVATIYNNLLYIKDRDA